MAPWMSPNFWTRMDTPWLAFPILPSTNTSSWYRDFSRHTAYATSSG